MIESPMSWTFTRLPWQLSSENTKKFDAELQILSIATRLRISTMAENEMAAPYANTKYSRKSGPSDRVSRKFRWG
jgi:hypothetical protein